MEINNLNYLQKFLGCSISNFETHYDLLKVAKAVNEIVSSIPNSRKRKHDGSFYIDALMRRDSTQITLDQFNIQEILNRVKVIPKGSYDQYDQDISFLKKIHKSLFFLRDNEYLILVQDKKI